MNYNELRDNFFAYYNYLIENIIESSQEEVDEFLKDYIPYNENNNIRSLSYLKNIQNSDYELGLMNEMLNNASDIDKAIISYQKNHNIDTLKSAIKNIKYPKNVVLIPNNLKIINIDNNKKTGK